MLSQIKFCSMSVRALTVLLLATFPMLSLACGCVFDPPGKLAAYGKNLFDSKWVDPEVATLRWKGKAYKLRLVSKKEAKKAKEGAKSVTVYTGSDSTIKVTVTATKGERICDGPVCEAAVYKARIVILKDGHNNTVAASGTCGC